MHDKTSNHKPLAQEKQKYTETSC